jgi:hypothetical protein
VPLEAGSVTTSKHGDARIVQVNRSAEISGNATAVLGTSLNGRAR